MGQDWESGTKLTCRPQGIGLRFTTLQLCTGPESQISNTLTLRVPEPQVSPHPDSTGSLDPYLFTPQFYRVPEL